MKNGSTYSSLKQNPPIFNGGANKNDKSPTSSKLTRDDHRAPRETISAKTALTGNVEGLLDAAVHVEADVREVLLAQSDAADGAAAVEHLAHQLLGAVVRQAADEYRPAARRVFARRRRRRV